ncbi:imidazole glycerol phosphate synthase subunit HisF [Candidatus Micrarchaeota archaeon CG_4_10_14_0_2_um_filter_49_7]|nr:MAG: imidazole glycerol phosphate synthase subunit HisF [Candidatus Micrarchaeota archaeon CG1_02_49_24]PIZ97866.1 MAG: imidazole glycerol phosphate synthase subunit HisF [Candidatus Micrarchaeota archaeon CG_4_10_14_0_2_um_filter_49_7]HII53535.1 imidazole glycerol phosphate synthase subunit HisF [Candidatus Micrarchaeota archaeon]
MFAKRIIPCLDVDKGVVVKGKSFKGLGYAGDAVELAKKYYVEGADELTILDITASKEKRKTMIDLIKRAEEEVFIPLTVGGGIRTVEDINALLRAGADKISINTAAVENPKLIGEGSKVCGSQCIVVAIDAKQTTKNKWEVYTYGGSKQTGIDAVGWAKKAERLGAGEILLTSMDQDGRQNGYDLALTKAVAGAVKIPVIASGGVGKPEHIYDALVNANASGALLASTLHYGKMTIKEIKGYLKGRGVNVRE